MSSSKSKRSSNTSSNSTTYDQRTTESINAGIGGDIEDSTVVSGVRGDVSLTTVQTDHGAVDKALDTVKDGTRELSSIIRSTNSDAFNFGTDALDFAGDAMDSIERANRDSLDLAGDSLDVVERTTDRALSSVDGSQERAFAFADDSLAYGYEFAGSVLGGIGDLAERFQTSNSDLVGEVLAANAEQQDKVINAAESINELSLTNLAAIKSGETIAKAADRNMVELVKAGVLVVGIGGAAYVAGNALKKARQ